MAEATSGIVETLLMRNLREVFGEADAQKRQRAIAEVWAEDGVMVDPHGRYEGHDAVDAVVAGLYARFPDFVFTPTGQPEAFNDIGRLTWGHGPAGAEPRLTGVDIIEVQGGRIISLFTFLDSAPTS